MFRLLRRRARRMRSDGRSQRGAVLVEAAIATPIFFMLVLGVTEVGLAMKDNLTLAHSVRSGSRVASAAGNDRYSDYGVIQAIARESTAMKRSEIVRIVIYRSNAAAADPTASCRAGTSSSVCNVYTPADFNRPKAQWGCRTDIGNPPDLAFCPTTRKVSITGTGPDYVGVWMQVEHHWITGMFGSTKTLTDKSVIRLEPRANDN